ncbi:molecular chaperone DnaJ [Candidatus Falkowbacteria bacterium]|nr:MAG: molecular chaperone DnaJ [Candidatus Falkowbacteria bacterium]
MSKDYYNILDIEKNASQEDVKKAFRKKAHECHPDKKGGDEAKFKKVNEAYQVLGNAKKRAQYDQFGSSFEHAQAGGGFQGFNGFRDASGFANGFNVEYEDLGDVFSGLGDIFGFGGGKRTARKRRGSDMQTILTIEFREAVFGAEKKINLRKKVKCDHCRGNLAEPGTKIETCQVCGGSGRVGKVQRTILGNIQVQAVCDNCAGEGKVYAKKCTKCAGTGAVMEAVSLKINIPAGINNNETIRLSGQGEAGEKGAGDGDLYIKIQVKSDSRFERQGYDIKTKIKISFTQAVLGDKINIETVDGLVKLKIPTGTQSGTVFKLRGKGVTKLQGSGKGDHYVEVIIKTPSFVTRKQKELLKELNL